MEESPTIQRIRQILGCDPPWFIRRFSASFVPHRVDVWLDHQAVSWPCPSCQRVLACGGHARERMFRCLAVREPEAHVYVRVPLVLCPRDGEQEVHVPWPREPTRWRFIQTTTAAASEDLTIH